MFEQVENSVVERSRNHQIILHVTKNIMKGYMYILLCSNGKYYTGSTNDLERRLSEHQRGEGANFTKKYLPVELLYYEEFQRIDEAFYREKQVQGWSREKKEALINGNYEKLHDLAECKNESHYLRAFRLRSMPNNQMKV